MMKKRILGVTRTSVKFFDRRTVGGEICHYKKGRQGFKSKIYEKWKTKDSIKINEIK